MDNKNPAVKIEQPAAVVEVPASVPTEDLEAKVSTLEAEKARLIEESANWKLAALQAKQRRKEGLEPEDDDEKLRRITREEIANSRLAEITKEQDAIIKKALKENKELKLANINKTNIPPAAIGTHSESRAVTDTLVTPEQLLAFKARGWTDKDIERYKKNLQRAGGR